MCIFTGNLVTGIKLKVRQNWKNRFGSKTSYLSYWHNNTKYKWSRAELSRAWSRAWSRAEQGTYWRKNLT